jgi:hypothetical protein
MTNEKIEGICGEELEINYDKKITRINIQLIKIKEEEDEFYKIVIEDSTNGNKTQPLIELHIKEALEIGPIINRLAYESLSRKIK